MQTNHMRHSRSAIESFIADANSLSESGLPASELARLYQAVTPLLQGVPLSSVTDTIDSATNAVLGLHPKLSRLEALMLVELIVLNHLTCETLTSTEAPAEAPTPPVMRQGSAIHQTPPSGKTVVRWNGQLFVAPYWTSFNLASDKGPLRATVTVVLDNREKCRVMTRGLPSTLAEELLLELIQAPRRTSHSALS